ncbi:MAG: aldose epimerase family protein [Pirellulales bacterium]
MSFRVAAAAALVAWGMLAMPHDADASEVAGPQPFGSTHDGQPVERYTLSGGKVTVRLMNRGATITEIHAPDRAQQTADVVLGFDTIAGYESEANQYFGCTTGRVCNRIAKAQFTLDGKIYKLAENSAPNHLHGGGLRSLDKIVWQGEKVVTQRGPGVRFTYLSPEGEEGYPGNLKLATTYILGDDGALWIEWEATSDKPTPVNLTNHSYFNLAGAGSGTVLDHELTLYADRFTPVDAGLIPTGKVESVVGSPLDFTTAKRIGERIEELTKTPTQGYDHNFVVMQGKQMPAAVAKLREPKSGRVLTVFSTQPGLQLYTGNFLTGQAGKGGKPYVYRGGVCLETQNFPDSVNQPTFPSIILKPGETYRQTCVYMFSAE